MVNTGSGFLRESIRRYLPGVAHAGAASALVGISGLLGLSTADAVTLPAPCVSGVCGSAATGFVQAGQAGATVAGNTLTVNQLTNNAVLNWASFNISADGRVIFNQPSSTATALNRIFQASPSQIFGLLQANGNVYLINQNGFIFGSTARVNVGGLLASSLNLDPNLFLNGILSQPIGANLAPAPVLTSDGRTSVLDANGNPVLGANGQPLAVQISVQPGAQITTNAVNGRILLASQQVDNAGTLSSPDGQVILAAGQKVYLEASTDPKLRGLLVEVDGGGTAVNEVSGVISADRGNVSLVGLAVNQLGRVSATTSVAANGSIRLVAGDNATFVTTDAAGDQQLGRTEGGSLTLGPQSQTTVLPDATDTATAVDAQVQLPSTVDLEGQSIVMQSGSLIRANGGQVTLTARANPSSPAPSSAAPDGSRIHLDPGSTIDVSGSVVDVPVTRNLVQVQLNSIELADSPDQKGGILLGQTVTVDARADNGNGTAVANVSGALALTKRDVLERTSNGGSVVFDSAGDVVVAQGATVNVSGGAVNYTPGVMETTRLITASGGAVDIGSASESAVYTGVMNPTSQTTSDKWGVINVVPTPGVSYYDPGYVQGASAGSIQIAAPAMVLNGSFVAQTVAGPLQRTPSTAPLGGQLIVGTPGSTTSDYRAPAITISASAPVIVVGDDSTLPSGMTLQLPANVLTDSGFSRVELASNGAITLPSGLPLTLPQNATLSLTAPRVELDSSITAIGGSITANSVFGVFNQTNDPTNLGVYVGDGVVFDVRGNWTNDAQVMDARPQGLISVNGGSVDLNQGIVGGTLSLGSNVDFAASGGAWLQTSGTLLGGNGGSIVLNAGPEGSIITGNGISFDAFGVQGGTGGRLALTVPRIAIGSGGPQWAGSQQVSYDRTTGGVFSVDSSLFSNFGFSTISLTANAASLLSDPTENTLTVGANTAIALTPNVLMGNANMAAGASANDVFGVTHQAQAPLYAQKPEQLTLSTTSDAGIDNGISPTGGLLMAAGSSITADPGSTINLLSQGVLEVAGNISAPSGTVLLQTANLGSFYSLDRIQLDRTADIDVSGRVVYQPTNTGLLEGTVYGGGTISLISSSGSVVTDSGSMLNFSGTQGTIDLISPLSGQPPSRQTIASAAGSLNLIGSESLTLLGDFKGAPGVGTTGLAAGGTLTVALSRQSDVSGFEPESGTYPSTPREIEVIPNSPPIVQDPASGLGIIDPVKIAASGVDALTLISDDAVVFGNGVNLNLARSLVLSTPAVGIVVGGTANVSADYLAIGAPILPNAAPSPTPGTGQLNFSAGSIDLVGNTVIQGAASTTLSSRGQIQLRGNPNLENLSDVGSFQVAGTLTLAAVDVVPATGVSFSIVAAGDTENDINIRQVGTFTQTPLSAAGQVSLTADNIVQGGTLIAPWGEISLNAANNLTLAAGSITSVSGSGAVIPYGRVDNGTTWYYGIADNNSGSLINAFDAPVQALPTRQISLNGGSVTMASGATVNVSGGGDLRAYAFTPGSGGTQDVLGSGNTPNANTPLLYAIVPTATAGSVPYDAFVYSGSGITPGESIYLSAGSGLPAGTYALLPARYATLPGAYLVSPAAGYTNLALGARASAADGAPIVAGYFTFGDSGIGATQTSGFIVHPGSYTSQLGTYTSVSASTFFDPTSAPGSRTVDGGVLSISDLNSLSVSGAVLTAGATGGVNATVELQAPILEIDAGSTATSADGVSRISAITLDAWAPGRLLLGGVQTADGSLHVGTDSVTLESGASITAPEVIVLANQSIAVNAGATLQSISGANGVDAPLGTLAAGTALTLSPDSNASAAVLAVSDTNAYIVTRAPGGDNSGTITVAPGALVASRGGLTLDAPGGALLADGALSGKDAFWSLGGNQVLFSETPTMGGVSIDKALVAQLSLARGVSISSTDSIDVTESVNLGSSGATTLAQLSISAPSLVSSGADAQFSATKIGLGNAQGSIAPLTTGTASLQLNAGEIDLNDGVLGLSGFGSIVMTAANRVMGAGIGGLASAGDLTVNTPLLTALSGAQSSLAAGGALLLAAPNGNAPSAAGLGTGGRLDLSGQTVTDSGVAILLPSGVLTMTSAQDLNIGAGSLFDVSGILPPGPGIAHGSAGGAIILTSETGAVSLAAGSGLKANGALGADAGTINITAAGEANLQASLSGQAGALQNEGGSFQLNAGSVADFGGLNAMLETGGFTQTRAIDVVNGDLNLAAGSTLTARNVLLSTDTGSINIAGRIDATSGAEKGSIELDAGTGLTLGATAVLLANGTDAAHRGGDILLSTTGGTLSIAATADIESQSQGGNGTLTLRAPATGSDVAIASLPTLLNRLGSVLIEPEFVDVLANGTPTADDFNGEASQVAAFFSANGAAIATRLGLANATNAVLQPFIEFNFAGDLNLPALDLSTWRFNGAPADVAFRASGNLNVLGSITDGFTMVQKKGLSYLSPMTTSSSGIALIAGANLAGSRAAATTTGAAADLTLGAGSVVSTGTGDIVLAAARDVVFGTGSSVYTGGLMAAPSLSARGGTPAVLTYMQDGGSIDIVAGRDVSGAPLAVPQEVTDWLPAVVSGGVATWGAAAQTFQWNVGALGGGDVKVSAGRDVLNLSAAASDTASTDGNGNITQYGGGSLVINSGRDIDSAYLYVGQGNLRLNALGSLGSSATDENGNPVTSLLLGGNTSFYVSAQGDVNIAGIASATAIYNPNATTYFFRTGANSQENVSSAGGSITFNSNSALALVGDAAAAHDADSFAVGAASLDIAAFAGNVSITDLITFPSASGQLSIYAAQNLTGNILRMSDTPSELVATASSPLLGCCTLVDQLDALGAIHTGDTQSATITAGVDITNLNLDLAKSSQLRAGRDIVNVVFVGQNVDPGDITLVSAGRDIINSQMTVGGPGAVDIIAGRNINFGSSQGATTVGNLIDPNLASSTGADLTLIAGLSAPLGTDQFLSTVITASLANQQTLIDYVQQITGITGLSYTQALSQFSTLSQLQQQPLLFDVFFGELISAGRSANSGVGDGFAQGYAAIDALFTNSRGTTNPYSGSITMPFSGIYTLDGGNIDILAPGGGLDVGLANPPAGSNLTRAASQLGIVTEKAGDINIYTYDDVLVNTSRVFTLDGGNIAIWSTTGSIDAGRGAKSSISAAPPRTVVSASGQVTVDFTNTVAGSGIQTIQTVPSVTPGNVDLDAPVGTVNAGEAGINSAGNLNIAARSVVNVGNITVGGTSAGVPPEVSGLGVSVAAAAAAGSGSTTAAAAALAGNAADSSKDAPLAQAALGWLEGFVTGLGEDNCRPDDMECLHRQKVN